MSTHRSSSSEGRARRRTLNRAETFFKNAAGVVTAVAGVAGAAVGVASLLSLNSGTVSGVSRDQIAKFAVWSVAAIAVPLVISVAAMLIRKSRQRDRRRVDAQIDSLASELESQPDEQLVEELLDRSGEHSELWHQRAQRKLVDDSRLRREVEAMALEFVPLRPRGAKRAMNHLRLQLALAVSRRIIGGSPPLDARHVAKWVVLSYRWPTLAAVAVRQPELVKQLEGATTAESLRTVLDREAIPSIDADALHLLLMREPTLDPVFRRLVGLDRQQDPDRAEPSPETA